MKRMYLVERGLETKLFSVVVISVKKRNYVQANTNNRVSAQILQTNQQIIFPFMCKVINLNRSIGL